MDDEPAWVAAVGHGQARGHFPGVHKGHTEVSKGSSQELVQWEDEPFAAIYGLVAGVDQLENHKIATTAAQIPVSHQIKKDSRKVVKWAQAPPWFGGPLPGPPALGPQSAGRPLVCEQSSGPSCGPASAALCSEWSPRPSGAPCDNWACRCMGFRAVERKREERTGYLELCTGIVYKYKFQPGLTFHNIGVLLMTI